MSTGKKLVIGLGVAVIASVVLYFVAKKYGWIGKESKASACGCGN